MPSEYVGELKKWVTQLAGADASGGGIGLARAVDLISKTFAVQPHEVAIFALATDERFLRFVVPEPLKLATLEDVENHFRATHKETIIKSVETLVVSGDVTRADPGPARDPSGRKTQARQRGTDDSPEKPEKAD